MSYKNAIFYIDLYGGGVGDGVRTTLSGVTVTNPSGSITRCNKTGHGLVTGAVVSLSNFSSWLNDSWKITKVDNDNFDLDTAVWQTTADASGDVVPFGGSCWADAWKTISGGATTSRIAAGDIIRISKTPNPVSIGNASWTNLSKTVTLATAQTLNVDMCEIAWTAANSATVTRQSVSTDAKEGNYCMQIAAPASPTTNRLYAYIPFSATDYSAYQNLSFWIKNEAALSTGNWKICLCSDNAGTTIVDSFDIPAIPSTGRWVPLTIVRTGGGNLGASIQSVALYSSSVSPTASKYIRLDNIIACYSSGLNLQSLLSKNGEAQNRTDGCYGIQSINGTTILLDDETIIRSNAGRGYSGTTETITTYFIETFKTAFATYSTDQIAGISKSGNVGNYIQYQFGYEIGTDNQNGETVLDGRNGYGYGLYSNFRDYCLFNHCSFVRYDTGIFIQNGFYLKVFNVNSHNCYYGARFTAVRTCIIEVISLNNNYIYGAYLNCFYNCRITILNSNNSYWGGIYCEDSKNSLIKCTNIRNNRDDAFNFSKSYFNVAILVNILNNNVNVSFKDSCNNTVVGIKNGISTIGISSNAGINYLVNSTLDVITEANMSSEPVNNWVWSLNHDNIIGNKWGFTYGATVNWQINSQHGLEPGSWKTTMISSTRDIYYPVKLKVAEIAGSAGTAMTIKAWVKKDHATYVGCRLVCYADDGAGLAAETFSTKADDTDWEELSFVVTPTGTNPVIQVFLESWYVTGLSNTYIGFITVT